MLRSFFVTKRTLTGSGRVMHVGPSFGGAGMRTVCMYGMWGAVAGSAAYLVAFVGIAPWLGELKFELVKKYPWLDRKDPDEMD